MCFVWISEQTAIISLYNINWLVCITEMECVYCAVRNESLNTIQIALCRIWWRFLVSVQWHRWFAEGVLSRRPRFDSRSFQVKFVVNTVFRGHNFFYSSSKGLKRQTWEINCLNIVRHCVTYLVQMEPLSQFAEWLFEVGHPHCV
jgi:hypothetical protein